MSTIKLGLYIFFILIINPSKVIAEIEIKMDTTTIKGNTDLPKIIYIVPWKQTKKTKHTEQELIIHSLYDGDILSPVLPDEILTNN